jgi:hypothetical protein
MDSFLCLLRFFAANLLPVVLCNSGQNDGKDMNSRRDAEAQSKDWPFLASLCASARFMLSSVLCVLCVFLRPILSSPSCFAIPDKTTAKT